MLVGLDVGTTGVKALALTPDGDVLATAAHGYALSTPHAEPSATTCSTPGC